MEYRWGGSVADIRVGANFLGFSFCLVSCISEKREYPPVLLLGLQRGEFPYIGGGGY